jgi:penicillin-binding protein 2
MGVMYRPHLVKYITDSRTGEQTMIEPEPLRRLPWKRQNVETIKNAHGRRQHPGTGARAFAGAGYTSGGKTGTAQVFSLKGAEPTRSRR